MREKQKAMILFFQLLNGSFLACKTFTLGKYYNYTTIDQNARGDRFASCENIVPQSQTSSQPPPPCERLLFNVKASLMIRSSFGIEKARSLCFMTMIISRKYMLITAVFVLFFS